ncbi:Hypothetical predicted protein [Pelobates cultripes]|uniref:Uncharacterized protein n=1 Tax=Pelobates cultripes TaxID=61616 RepID=A0AAD1VXM1_PELCU|nr:Hypothetical predicted protein [Pelobates cultripes]
MPGYATQAGSTLVNQPTPELSVSHNLEPKEAGCGPRRTELGGALLTPTLGAPNRCQPAPPPSGRAGVIPVQPLQATELLQAERTEPHRMHANTQVFPLADATCDINCHTARHLTQSKLDAIFNAFWAKLVSREWQANKSTNPPGGKSESPCRSRTSPHPTKSQKWRRRQKPLPHT